MLAPTRPLVLTLTLDKPTQAFLTDLRSRYFPSHRNFLSAHITLFHALPPNRFPEIDEHLTRASDTAGWEVFICDPTKMGQRGVMVLARERGGHARDIHQRVLEALREGVREGKDGVTEQDNRALGRLHVTVLNKAEGEKEVEKCLKEVQGVFEGLGKGGKSGQKSGRAVGLQLWEYMGGPWKPLKSYQFNGEEGG